VRDNTSWIIGRIVRETDGWITGSKWTNKDALKKTIKRRWDDEKEAAEREVCGLGNGISKPAQAGLCI